MSEGMLRPARTRKWDSAIAHDSKRTAFRILGGAGRGSKATSPGKGPPEQENPIQQWKADWKLLANTLEMLGGILRPPLPGKARQNEKTAFSNRKSIGHFCRTLLDVFGAVAAKA